MENTKPSDAQSLNQSPSNDNEEKEGDFLKVVKNLNYDDFKNIAKMPCARQSFLYGIGGGTTVGFLRFIQKGKFRKIIDNTGDERVEQNKRNFYDYNVGNVFSATNWAVGSFCLISVGIWEYCHFRRVNQRQKIKAITQKLNELSRKKALEKASENINNDSKS
ncbi:8592_t:CDS:2 [Acaulospora morrowiae]|uniref:Cytochrome c oxidase assembly protein COX20, mitochondrial n=1 Tax=Acaulospora morrowiae TaxID=94023 RepID=A0A9N9ACF8_9GLOM|nr:8592_t:CDS:2 [Acaulospora morrowiae]